jgi:ATP-dependent protease ClpP protease subunit
MRGFIRSSDDPPRGRVRPYPGVVHRPQRDADSQRDWELVLCGDLTDKQVELTERLVEVPRCSRGTIYFDSCGGNVYVGLSLAALIRLRGLDPVAVVAGECSSAALLPFAACRRRFVMPQSTLLFHPMRWQSEEDVRLEEAAEWARHFSHLEKDLDGLLCRMLNVSEETLQQWTRPGKFLTGRELAAAGVAQLVDMFAGDVWTQMRALRHATGETRAES